MLLEKIGKGIAQCMPAPGSVSRSGSAACRSEAAVAAAARRYGYEKWTTDWREQVNDPDIQLFDNGGPNDAHAEPCIVAAEAGKHVFCEKPFPETPRLISFCSI